MPVQKKSAQKKKSVKKTVQKSSVASAKNKAWKSVLSSQIWPNERDILFRPDRLKYVRKLLPPTDCVFCSALKAGVSQDSLVIGVTQHSMVILNKFPYNSGHVLVLPKRHVADPKELSEAEFIDVSLVQKKIIEMLQVVYKPGGLNMGLNLGATAGAGIPGHLHYHLIPRWSGDLNFFPLIAETKVVVESLEQTYLQLRKAWPQFFKSKES